MLHVLITLKLSTFMLACLHDWQSSMWSRIADFALGWRCSCIVVPKCRVVIPMYDIFVSHEQENLYTTFDTNSTGVTYFN